MAALIAVTAAVFVATDAPDVISPNIAFEVDSLDDVPKAVRAVNRQSGDDTRCVAVPETVNDKIVVSVYCPRSTTRNWAFFPVE